jgi:hypothetical protein
MSYQLADDETIHTYKKKLILSAAYHTHLPAVTKHKIPLHEIYVNMLNTML